MKTIILASIFLTGATVIQAQTIEQGQQQLYYERYASAENTFHQVLKQDPNNAGAWLNLTTTYLEEDKLDKASDTIQLAPAAIKADPFFQVAQGTILLEQNKNAEAANLFNAALKETREKNVHILSAIADAHINAKNGDGNYAVQLLEKAIKRDKKNAKLLVQLGDAYRKLANGTEAYRAYQRALQADDKYALAYHRLGGIFLSQKNADMYVDYFQKAIQADPNFAPSLYNLYVHEFSHDPAKAMQYYTDYVAKSDKSLQTEYDMVDLLYLTKQYDQAIEKATALVNTHGEEAKPRLFKLISFSYAEKKDTANAVTFLEKYFAKEVDTNFTAKDFVTMGEFYGALPGADSTSAAYNDSMATNYLVKAVAIEKDTAAGYGYYKKLAEMAKARKDYAEQATWLEKYYTGNDKATNLDLFNWGLGHYLSGNYVMADSVFGKYVAKYPEQSFGYYWQAKSQSLVDKEMTEGLAIPTYQKLIEVLQKDSADANTKKWLVEAYGYLAAYEANTKKNYPEAVEYFEKVLEVDPENASAKQYIAILEKSIDQQSRQQKQTDAEAVSGESNGSNK